MDEKKRIAEIDRLLKKAEDVHYDSVAADTLRKIAETHLSVLRLRRSGYTPTPWQSSYGPSGLMQG